MSKPVNKKQLRQVLRHQRRVLPAALKTQMAAQIAEHFFTLSEFQHSQHIAYYLPHDGEVNPYFIVAQSEKNNKRGYLPIITDVDSLEFYAYRPGEALKKNRFGIGEPDITSQHRISARDLDIVLLPLVAFDEQGNRIGRGAGYYDRTFAFLHDPNSPNKPILVGLAYEFQKIPRFQPEAWDITLNMIVTEQKVYRSYSA